MRTYILLIFLICLTAVFGQSSKNTQINGFSKGCFNVSYNYYPTFTSTINSQIEAFGPDKFEENIFLYGISLQSNVDASLGIGIEFLFGNEETGKIVDLEDQDLNPISLDRSVMYNLTFWNLTINYRKSMMGRLEFFGVLKGGYGFLDLMMSQDYGDQSFDDMWNSYEPQSYLEDYNRSSVYSANVYAFTSETGLRMFVSSRVAVGLTVGYTYCIVSEDGELNYGFESIKNVPDLDFEGLNFGLGLYFGF